ncbi:hypothetical protein B7P43_G16327 [Cryptotermes secundus]|uniref:Pre-C2HC domain-containing protein n=1 Tax=Cryptotermes secundus TaxID=105785 RepID=A0A2J7QUP5_9NEOP|nr:hypothetical protein B7P43_G16327 [Cryptotermes secundus]
MHFVDLEPKENNKTIYNIDFICSTIITVEAPRKKNITAQCTRCQNYGHTKTYCTRPFMCVKCGGDHNTTMCRKSPNTPATCGLCGGAHPANYKGCDIYLKLQKARNHKEHQQYRNTTQQNVNININDNKQFQLWGCAKPSNTQIIQRLQSRVLRAITNAPWYVSNRALHNDLQVPYVTDEIRRLALLYKQRLQGHDNRLIEEIRNPPNVVRRLKRQWLSDLPNRQN